MSSTYLRTLIYDIKNQDFSDFGIHTTNIQPPQVRNINNPQITREGQHATPNLITLPWCSIHITMPLSYNTKPLASIQKNDTNQWDCTTFVTIKKQRINRRHWIITEDSAYIICLQGWQGHWCYRIHLQLHSLVRRIRGPISLSQKSPSSPRWNWSAAARITTLVKINENKRC